MGEMVDKMKLDGASLAVLLAAVLVDLACRFAPAGLPYVFPFIFNAPVFLGCWFVVLWYFRGMARTPLAERPGWVRRGFFLLGVASIYFVLQTRFEYLTQHMFFLNRVQAVTIGMAAPFCIGIGWMNEVLARGAPGWLVRFMRSAGASRTGRVMMHPVVAMVVFFVTTDVWLIPDVHFDAMIDPLLYAVMNLSCLGGGLLFWLVVLDPRPVPQSRYSYLARAAAGFLVMFPQIVISAYIALTSTDLYAFYTLCGRIFPAVSPHYDQTLGGLIQWIPPGMMNTAALIITLNALRLHDVKADEEFVTPPGAKVYKASWLGQ